MRTGILDRDSQLAAVQAFTRGCSTFWYAKSPDDRWRCYLARPIWFKSGEEIEESLAWQESEIGERMIIQEQPSEIADIDADASESEVEAGGIVPVGTICLASMTEQQRSFLSPRRRRNTEALIKMLDAIASRIVSP